MTGAVRLFKVGMRICGVISNDKVQAANCRYPPLLTHVHVLECVLCRVHSATRAAMYRDAV